MGKEMKRIASWGLIFAIAAAMIGCTTSGWDSMESTESGEITAITENVVTRVPDFGYSESTAETSEAAEPSAEAAVPSTKATQPGGSGGSTAAATAQETDPKPTEPKTTEPQPKPTESQPTESQSNPSEPELTDPVPTEPAPTVHTHSYTKTVAVPTCTEQGYTVYQCACGDSFKDDYTSAKGHAWGDWVTTKEASITAEGEQKRTCSVCGASETKAIPKLETELIDTAELEKYGRQYTENHYDFVVNIGTRAGYAPGYESLITSMAIGYHMVASKIDTLAANLLSAHGTTYFYFDIEVVEEGNGYYTIWAYYG